MHKAPLYERASAHQGEHAGMMRTRAEHGRREQTHKQVGDGTWPWPAVVKTHNQKAREGPTQIDRDTVPRDVGRLPTPEHREDSLHQLHTRRSLFRRRLSERVLP